MSQRAGYGQRRIRITPEVFEAWLIRGNPVVTGLPDDARFVRLWPSDGGDSYIMVFESSAWDELTEGEEIPLVTFEVVSLNEELRGLIDNWRDREIQPYGMNWRKPADELEALLE